MNYERLLRRLRQQVFDHPNPEKCERVLAKVKVKFLNSSAHQLHLKEREHARSEAALRLWS